MAVLASALARQQVRSAGVVAAGVVLNKLTGAGAMAVDEGGRCGTATAAATAAAGNGRGDELLGGGRGRGGACSRGGGRGRAGGRRELPRGRPPWWPLAPCPCAARWWQRSGGHPNRECPVHRAQTRRPNPFSSHRPPLAPPPPRTLCFEAAVVTESVPARSRRPHAPSSGGTAATGTAAAAAAAAAVASWVAASPAACGAALVATASRTSAAGTTAAPPTASTSRRRGGGAVAVAVVVAFDGGREARKSQSLESCEGAPRRRCWVPAPWSGGTRWVGCACAVGRGSRRSVEGAPSPPPLCRRLCGGGRCRLCRQGAGHAIRTSSLLPTR